MTTALPATIDLPAAVRDHPLFGRLGAAAQAALCGQLQAEVAEAGACVAEGAALAQRLGWVLAGVPCHRS
jgi:hypothetical protein